MVRNVTSNNDFPIARKFGRHLATLDERLNGTMALNQFWGTFYLYVLLELN